MKLSMPPARIAFGLVLIGLGVTGLVNGGFALVWQYVPKGLPAYTALAYLCAGVELLAGLGLLSNPHSPSLPACHSCCCCYGWRC
jgi:uncharacterized membrane protein YphA (DoxX/SURF4 family)